MTTPLIPVPPQKPGATAPLGIYIPSYNNSAQVCESVASCPAGLPITISDNHSEPEHRRVLEGLRPRCDVVFHSANQGRVENWAFCVRHFVEQTERGGPVWMKWLFAGDTLTPDITRLLEQALRGYPTARLVIAEHDMADETGRKRWRTLEGTQLTEPARALRLAAATGNWFGPPLAHFVHRDAVAPGFDFGDLPWSADFRFCLTIAAAFPVLYLAQNVGVFHKRHRNYYAAHANSAQMVVEEAVVRIEAARQYKTLTGDTTGFNTLLEQINEFAARETMRCALSQPETRAFAQDAARSLGLRRLVALAVSETLNRLRPRRLPHKPAD